MEETINKIQELCFLKKTKFKWPKVKPPVIPKPMAMSLNQLSSFETILKEDEHFNIFDIDREKLKQMSEKQYKYVLSLIFNKNYFKAKEIVSKYLNLK